MKFQLKVKIIRELSFTDVKTFIKKLMKLFHLFTKKLELFWENKLNNLLFLF